MVSHQDNINNYVDSTTYFTHIPHDLLTAQYLMQGASSHHFPEVLTGGQNSISGAFSRLYLYLNTSIKSKCLRTVHMSTSIGDEIEPRGFPARLD